MTAAGKPFSAAGFGNWFRDMCREAGLHGFSAHGLRKAGCRRLAEAGCSASEIAAWSGHRTLSEIAHYTRSVEQAAMARAAARPNPHRAGSAESKPHDGTILTNKVNEMWGTDMTQTITVEEGRALFLPALSAEMNGHRRLIQVPRDAAVEVRIVRGRDFRFWLGPEGRAIGDLRRLGARFVNDRDRNRHVARLRLDDAFKREAFGIGFGVGILTRDSRTRASPSLSTTVISKVGDSRRSTAITRSPIFGNSAPSLS
jgi:hypothetical protein